MIGAVAGYRGGLLDTPSCGSPEMLQSVPRLFLAILAWAVFGAGMDKLVLLLGLTSWPLLARVVRTETMSVKRWPFVAAARAIRARDTRSLFRHVGPNVLPVAVVVISLMGSRVFLIAAGLSFLGLGDAHQISWGYLINDAQRFLPVAWWMSAFPGLAIVVAVLGLSLRSDAFNDVPNPLTARRAPGRCSGRTRRHEYFRPKNE